MDYRERLDQTLPCEDICDVEMELIWEHRGRGSEDGLAVISRATRRHFGTVRVCKLSGQTPDGLGFVYRIDAETANEERIDRYESDLENELDAFDDLTVTDIRVTPLNDHEEC